MTDGCGTFRSLSNFFNYHPYDGATVWDGYSYLYRPEGETAVRVVNNIIRSRIARASHGTPTREPLRIYKRAGRPELNERYARIRKNLANA